MADDFDIEIKVGAAEANAELAKNEAASRAADKAADNLVGTFARLAAVLNRDQAELAKARQVSDNLSGSFRGLANAIRAEQLNTTARAFAGLTEQMEREKTMLEQIHGPAKQLGQDLQTLEMLYKRGAISAGEYTDQLQKMGQVHGPSADQAGKASSGLSGTAIGAGLGAAAGLGALAVGGIKEDVELWNQRKDAEINATNALLKFVDTRAQAEAMVGQLSSTAKELHVSIDTVATSFASVREATDDMNLTTQQQIDLQRNLAEIMEIDGKSIAGVEDVMTRLTYAMNVGNLEFRDLKAITKEYNDTGEAFAKATGKSTLELEAMAKSGKLNRDMIRQMMVGVADSTEIHKKHAEVLKTVDQLMSDEKKTRLDASMEWLLIKEHVDGAAESYVSLDERAARIANDMQRQRKNLDDATSGWHELDSALTKVINTVGQLGQATTAFTSFDEFGARFKRALDIRMSVANAQTDLQRLQEDVKSGMLDMNQQVKSAMDADRAAIDPEGFASYKRIVGDVLDPLRQFNLDQRTLNNLLHDGTITAKQYREEAAKLIQAYDSRPSAFDPSEWERNVVDAKAAAKDVTDNIDLSSFGPPKFLDNNFLDIVPDVGALGSANDALKSYDEQLAKHQKQLDEIKGHLQPIEDGLVELATTGKISWSNMIDSMIADVARLLADDGLKELIAALKPGPKVGMSGLAASIGAAVVGGGSHADGGTFIAPSTGGGVDSILMVSRVSPRERIDYTPAGQMPAAASSAPAGPTNLTVQVVNKQNNRMLHKDAGFVHSMRQVVLENPGLFKPLLDRR